jgi:hypothetical protein
MVARILAAVAAVAMVAGAIVVRDRIDSRAPQQPTATRTACSTELAAACSDLDDVAAVADQLIAVAGPRDAPIAEWATAGPWPQIVDEARSAASRPKLFSSNEAVASTELVAVIRQMPPQCSGKPVTWLCIGDAAGQTGATAGARPAVAAPSRSSSTRLLLRAALVGAKLGRTDYASNDLTLDADALNWIAAAERGIEAGRGRGAPTLTDFNVVPAADVFITTAADAQAAAGKGFQVVRPTPVVRVDAVVGHIGDGGADPKAIGDRLRGAGWQAPSKAPNNGLPSPGVLVALRGVG